jgi:hypothetical protein
VQPEQWVAVFFSERLELALLTAEPGEGFRRGATWYRSQSPGVVSAFYDRLVNSDGELVGVQVWPLAERTDFVLSHLPSRAYLRVPVGQGCFEIYFGAKAEPATSEGDQAFGGRLYMSESGDLSLTIDLGYLLQSQAELDELRRADMDWVDLPTV